MSVYLNRAYEAIRPLSAISAADVARDTALRRISSGRRVNTAADDPSGIVLINALRAQVASLQRVQSGTQHSGSLLDVAESSLRDAGNLLLRLRELFSAAVQDRNLAPDQLRARQREVDDILRGLDRLSTRTNFGGKRLFDGATFARTADFISDPSQIGAEEVFAPANSRIALGVHTLRTRAVSLVRDITGDDLAVNNSIANGEGGRISDAADADGPFRMAIGSADGALIAYADSARNIVARGPRDTGDSVGGTTTEYTFASAADVGEVVRSLSPLTADTVVYAAVNGGLSKVVTQNLRTGSKTVLSLPGSFNPSPAGASNVVFEYDAKGLVLDSKPIGVAVQGLAAHPSDTSLLLGLVGNNLVKITKATGAVTAYTYQGLGAEPAPSNPTALAAIGGTVYLTDTATGIYRFTLNDVTDEATLTSPVLRYLSTETVTEASPNPDGIASIQVTGDPTAVVPSALPASTGTVSITFGNVNAAGQIPYTITGPLSGSGVITQGVVNNVSDGAGATVTQISQVNTTNPVTGTPDGYGYSQSAAGPSTDYTTVDGGRMKVAVNPFGPAGFSFSGGTALNITMPDLGMDPSLNTGAGVAAFLESAINTASGVPGLVDVEFSGGKYVILSDNAAVTPAASVVNVTGNGQDAQVNGAAIPGGELGQRAGIVAGRLRVDVNGAAANVTGITNGTLSLAGLASRLNTAIVGAGISSTKGVFANNGNTNMIFIGRETGSVGGSRPYATVGSHPVATTSALTFGNPPSTTDLTTISSSVSMKVSITGTGSLGNFKTLTFATPGLTDGNSVAAAVKSAILSNFDLDSSNFDFRWTGARFEASSDVSLTDDTRGGVAIYFQETGSTMANALGLTPTGVAGSTTAAGQVTAGETDVYALSFVTASGGSASNTGIIDAGRILRLGNSWSGTKEEGGGIQNGDKVTFSLLRGYYEFGGFGGGAEVLGSLSNATKVVRVNPATGAELGSITLPTSLNNTTSNAFDQNGSTLYYDIAGTDKIAILSLSGTTATLTGLVQKPSTTSVGGLASDATSLYIMDNGGVPTLYTVDATVPPTSGKVILSSSTTGGALTVVSSAGGENIDPRASANGKAVVYEKDSAGVRELRLVRLDGGDVGALGVKEQVIASTASPGAPVPDVPGNAGGKVFNARVHEDGAGGFTVYYEVDNAGTREIWTRTGNASTLNAASLLTTGEAPALSANGLYLAYVENTGPGAGYAAVREISSATTVYLYPDGNSGQATALGPPATYPGNGVIGGATPVFTADNHVVFINPTAGGGEGEVFVYRLTDPETGAFSPRVIRPSDNLPADNFTDPSYIQAGEPANAIFLQNPEISVGATMVEETFTLEATADPDNEDSTIFSVTGSVTGSHAPVRLGEVYTTDAGIGGAGAGLRFQLRDDGQYAVGDIIDIDIDTAVVARLDQGPEQLVNASTRYFFENERGENIGVDFGGFIPDEERSVLIRVGGVQQVQVGANALGQTPLVLDDLSTRGLGLTGLSLEDDLGPAFNNLTVTPAVGEADDALRFAAPPSIDSAEFVPRQETYTLTFTADDRVTVSGSVTGSIAENVVRDRNGLVRFRGVTVALEGESKTGDAISFTYDGNRGSLGRIDRALNIVREDMVALGALRKNLASFGAELSDNILSASQVDSIAGDADVAEELVKFTRSHLLSSQFAAYGAAAQLTSDQVLSLLDISFAR
ncbi:MAG: hypothetical protein HY719_01645 [Planctomycetes bacterium]|nr:hypothetical protein [Planctomycetota bacterium]